MAMCPLPAILWWIMLSTPGGRVTFKIIVLFTCLPSGDKGMRNQWPTPSADAQRLSQNPDSTTGSMKEVVYLIEVCPVLLIVSSWSKIAPACFNHCSLTDAAWFAYVWSDLGPIGHASSSNSSRLRCILDTLLTSPHACWLRLTSIALHAM